MDLTDEMRKRSWEWAKASLVGTGSHTALAPPLENPEAGGARPLLQQRAEAAGPVNSAAAWPSGGGRPGHARGALLLECPGQARHRRGPASAPCCLLPVRPPPAPLSQGKVMSNPGLGVLKVILSIKVSFSSVPRRLLGLLFILIKVERKSLSLSFTSLKISFTVV